MKKLSGSSPWMQFWGEDFMGSTEYWTAEERGAYLILLWKSWKTDGLDPDENRLFGIDPAIKPSWEKLKSKFPIAKPGDGKRRNPRQEEIRAKMIEISSKNREAGRLGADSRWRNDGERHSERHEKTAKSDGETIALSPITLHLSDSTSQNSTPHSENGGAISAGVVPSAPHPTATRPAAPLKISAIVEHERSIVASIGATGQSVFDGQATVFKRRLRLHGLGESEITTAWIAAVEKWQRKNVRPLDAIASIAEDMPDKIRDRPALIRSRVREAVKLDIPTPTAP